MRRSTQLAVSAVCAYQQINQESFDGELSDVPVTWGNLDKQNADGITHFTVDGSISIEVDRTESEALATEILKHEACHVFVSQGEPDKHGQMFQGCMARFKNQEQ